MKEKEPTFTKEDQAALYRLPEGQRMGFFMRFSKIAQEKAIVDSEWNETMERLQIETSDLIRDIKEALRDAKNKKN